MRLLKQFSTAATIITMLALPFGVMGCAQDAPPANTPGASDTGAGDTSPVSDADADLDSDLGDPGAGSNL